MTFGVEKSALDLLALSRGLIALGLPVVHIALVPSYSDYFTETAARYALYRPQYPEHLFDWLAQQTALRDQAWDCATGTGQAAGPLASRFREVVATDPSLAQIGQAARYPNVHYAVMTAELSGLGDHVVDLVTVAQALHWFRLDEFYTEVRRVVRPGGILAVWNYALCSLGDPLLDALLQNFYTQEVGPFWPAERALVDAGYGALEFPFAERDVPLVNMEADWTLAQFAGYLSTWSAVTRYRAAKRVDPVAPFIQKLAPSWSSNDGVRRVRWPLEVRVGEL